MHVVVLAIIAFAIFFGAFHEEPEVRQRVGVQLEIGKGVDVDLDYKIKIEGGKGRAVIKID